MIEDTSSVIIFGVGLGVSETINEYAPLRAFIVEILYSYEIPLMSPSTIYLFSVE